MTVKEMTVPIQAAFWVWYQTGLEGSGRRSLRKTAKKLKRGLETLVEWSESYSWEELAEAKDRETAEAIDRAIMKKILDKSTEILDRQRQLIALVYDKATDYLLDPETKITPDVLLRFLEYESNLHGSGPKKQEETVITLRAVLEHLPSEVTNGFLRGYRELRNNGRTGVLPGGGPESGDPCRN